jgi:hypothetical protein
LYEPAKATAGDTWTWTREGGDYRASAGWTLTYYFAREADAPKVITASASGDNFTTTVAAATSAAWAPGLYKWTARVSKGSEVYTVDSGDLVVMPDPIASVDRRTLAEKCRDAIEAALRDTAGDLTVEYELDGVKVKKDRAAALRELAAWRARVRLESGAPIRGIPVRFTHV